MDAKEIAEILTAREKTVSVAEADTAGLIGYIDRKSTRLNSSHVVISYAVFCLKKKRKNKTKCTSS